METITTYFREIEQMLQNISLQAVIEVLHVLEKAYYNRQRIFIMGNGGSAATASHFALDLAKNTIATGAPRLKVISLTDHVPLITAWGNDASYEAIFAQQLLALLEPGDVVIGISTSGNSPNVLQAISTAKQLGAYIIGFLGADGGAVKQLADTYVLAPGHNQEQEEDFHLILAHIVTRHMRQIMRLSPTKQEESMVATPASSERTLTR